MLSQSAAPICSKCHDIKHPDVLALVLCTSERCTGTEHICCCDSSAHQSQRLHHHWHSRFKAKEWQVYRQYWLPMHHVISHRQKRQIGSHACMTHSCLLTTTAAWTPNSARTIKMMLSFIMSTATKLDEGLINTCETVRWLSSECNKPTRSFSQNDLDLGQEATLCSLVAGKDGKDHQQQRITVKLFSLGKDHQWTSVTSSQHPRDYLWVAPMCTRSKPFNKRITA